MRIVVLHAGGVGDLVLIETLLAGLRERSPHARIELVCRADVAPVAALYATPPDAVHTFHFNPYTWDRPEIAIAQSAALISEIPIEDIDLFVSAELRATWLSEILAAALPSRDALFGDASLDERSTARIAVRGLGLHVRAGIRRLERIDEHELDRYARLIDVPRRLPHLRPLRRDVPDADRPLVVFPLGQPELKQWPFDRVADACREIVRGQPRELVLVGSPSERATLEQFAAEYGSPTFTVADGSPDIAQTAGLLANAAGYLGIDTGLAHLAAAYGVPGVTIYGGGTWPAYAPWAPRSVGVVAPLPCFGCGWDCAFGHSYCIEAIAVEDVVQAFTAAVASTPEGSGEPAVTWLQAYETRERSVLGEASHRYREAQADRAARYRGILRLRDILERYALRSRQRQFRPSALTQRLAALARRLNERDDPAG